MDLDALSEHENAARILAEGWLLFQQKGYRGVTMDEVCRRCGLTKPTLYYYFQDKETLFLRVLQHKLGGFHASIQLPGSLAERLQRFAAGILDSFLSGYSSLERDYTFIQKPEYLQAIRATFHSELFGPLTALMQAGLESGELAGADATLLARIFLGMINNFIGRVAESGGSSAALAATLTAYFLDGARRRPSGG